MIEVKITVEAPGLTEALFRVADAIEHRAEGVAQPKERKQTMNASQIAKKASSKASDAQPVQQQPQQPQPAEAAQSAQEAAVQAPMQEQPPQQPQAAQSAQTTQTGNPAITLETLSRAGAALIDAGMLPQVMQTIQKYGVATITQLKPDVYPALAADLRALGAQI